MRIRILNNRVGRTLGIITHRDIDRAASSPPRQPPNHSSIPMANNLFLITGGGLRQFRRVGVPDHPDKRDEGGHRYCPRVTLNKWWVGVRIANIIFKLRDQIDVLLFFNGAATRCAAAIVPCRFLNIRCIVILTYLGAFPPWRTTIRESGRRGRIW